MLRINPISNYNVVNMKSSDKTQNGKQKKTYTPVQTALLCTSAAGITALAALGILLAKGRFNVMSYEKALDKLGLTVKDDLVVLKNSGEKYTGYLKRNIKANEKETAKFVDGRLSEKVYHNMFGRELKGYFYENSNLRLYVTGHTGFRRKTFGYTYVNDGGEAKKGDVFKAEIKSVFQWARDAVKNKHLA